MFFLLRDHDDNAIVLGWNIGLVNPTASLTLHVKGGKGGKGKGGEPDNVKGGKDIVKGGKHKDGKGKLETPNWRGHCQIPPPSEMS